MSENVELNGISAIQGLISNLLQLSQQEKGSPQIRGSGQTTVQPQAEVITTAIKQNPNFTLPDSPVPELYFPKSLSHILTGDIQGMDPRALAAMFQKLGMDYEKRLRKALDLNEPAQSQELREIKDTVKAQLITAAKSNPEAKLLLDNLTTLQLKPSAEHDSQVYFIMDLPYRLKDNVQQARIAVYGDKKGKTIDTEHCRIGLHTVTDTLGAVGIDALFHDRAITVTLITEMPDLVATLWSQLQDSVVEHFAEQGYQLLGVRVSSFSDERFNSFIQGIEPKGVDIKI